MFSQHIYQNLTRLTSAMIGASLVTLALLMFMHQLIKIDAPIEIVDAPKVHIPIMEKDRTIVEQTNIKPEPPIEPSQPPEDNFDPLPNDGPDIQYTMAAPTFSGPSGTEFQSPASGGAVSMMQVAPTYPERARRRGIEGYVDLVFDLTATGQTHNIRILKAEPQGYFENASIRALKKWKYKPAMDDGKAIAMPDMTTRISYNLDQ